MSLKGAEIKKMENESGKNKGHWISKIKSYCENEITQRTTPRRIQKRKKIEKEKRGFN